MAKSADSEDNSRDVPLHSGVSDTHDLHHDRHDPDHALKTIRTAGSVSTSAELFEKMYLTPKNRVLNNIRSTFGNPTPLCLVGFLLCITALSNVLMGWRGAGGLGAAEVGAYYFFGGLLMIIGCVFELILGNTFACVVFASFGAFWLTFAATLTPFYNASIAYQPDDPATAASNPVFTATRSHDRYFPPFDAALLDIELVQQHEYKTGRQRQPPRWVEKSHEAELMANNTPTSVGLTEERDPVQPSTTRDKGCSSNVGHQSASPRPSLTERAMSKIMIVPKSVEVLGTPFPADSATGLEDVATNSSSASSDCSNPQAGFTEQANPFVHGNLDLDTIHPPLAPEVSRLSTVEDKTLEAWSRYSLVRQRWLRAQEAVTLVDLFFKYLSPMSPVLMSEFQNHSTYQRLITEDHDLVTLLCLARSFLEQVVLGRGTHSAKRMSVLSIIDSCLLITDWHPRYADFPAEDEISGDLCPSHQPNQPYDTSRSDSHLIR
ncbi:hypothetical protein AYO20_04797 [Fonsecaea nubica]|uniref:Uncharacterized protein n=1 Tax=Fonsecaea nubica TaxID=856822 RepID=A0A178D3Z1_9EURO|nr:hypothetical protein AYO20_04797 [Fonsecaea nubica]OAL35891.1 hypothetical protein AYO20_04797 [Fonsecaea nubica]